MEFFIKVVIAGVLGLIWGYLAQMLFGSPMITGLGAALIAAVVLLK